MNEHSSENHASTERIIKLSPIVQDEWTKMHEAEWLSYKYSIMPTDLHEDGSWVTPPSFSIIRDDQCQK